MEVAKRLRHTEVEVTVIDRANHHLFQPLLYQVATAGLSPANIATPIRSLLRRTDNMTVLMDEVVDVQPDENCVILKRSKPMAYDYLVVATGATHSYFGKDEWEQFAPGLKTVEDATSIRRNILMSFELAETATNLAEIQDLMTFLIVGAGPTGVELAGSIAELARRALNADFDRIRPDTARIILLEAGPRVLSAFPEELSKRAEQDLKRLGVEVRLNTMVQGIDARGVDTSAGRINSRTVIWAAGVKASPVTKWLKVEGDRNGRVPVGPDLTLADKPNVFCIGDCALALDANGKPLPGIAPVAMQQGRYVAKLIRSRNAGRDLPPFKYFDKGMLATVGRRAAVGSYGKIRMNGTLAWAAWLFVHIAYLIGFKNKLLVFIQWAWAYLTWERGARLITYCRDE
jgi:NADH:ubiquinone reductase (H+-translocating)